MNFLKEKKIAQSTQFAEKVCRKVQTNHRTFWNQSERLNTVQIFKFAIQLLEKELSKVQHKNVKFSFHFLSKSIFIGTASWKYFNELNWCPVVKFNVVSTNCLHWTTLQLLRYVAVCSADPAVCWKHHASYFSNLRILELLRISVMKSYGVFYLQKAKSRWKHSKMKNIFWKRAPLTIMKHSLITVLILHLLNNFALRSSKNLKGALCL